MTRSQGWWLHCLLSNTNCYNSENTVLIFRNASHLRSLTKQTGTARTLEILIIRSLRDLKLNSLSSGNKILILFSKLVFLSPALNSQNLWAFRLYLDHVYQISFVYTSLKGKILKQSHNHRSGFKKNKADQVVTHATDGRMICTDGFRTRYNSPPVTHVTITTLFCLCYSVLKYTLVWFGKHI